MNTPLGIYWIQGLVDDEWSNLQRCEDHADAIAKMAPLGSDRRYRELRLVLAQAQKGTIEYTTLVTVRDNEIVSDESLFGSLLPEGPQNSPNVAASPSKHRWQIPVLVLTLVAAIFGGLVIADRYPELALAAYKGLGWTSERETQPVIAHKTPVPATNYADRLFNAVDTDDGPAIRRLMAERPGDLNLDELLLFVDDSWGTGPRKITDYALLGGNMSAADALLAAGAVPSDWLLAMLRRRPAETRLTLVAALLKEFGLAQPVSLNRVIMESAREFAGR